jgi:proline racemase
MKDLPPKTLKKIVETLKSLEVNVNELLKITHPKNESKKTIQHIHRKNY